MDEEEKYFFERQTVFLTENFNISTTTTTWTQTWRSPTTLACTWRRTTTWTLRGGGGLGFLANRPHFWGWDCTCPLRYWSWRICSWNICSPLFWDSFSPYFGIASPPILGHLLSLILDICSRTVVPPLLGHLLSFTKLEQYHGRLWLRLNRRPEEDLPTVLWHVVQPRGRYFLFAAWGHPLRPPDQRAHHLYTMVTTKHSEAGDPIKAIRISDPEVHTRFAGKIAKV